MKYSFVFLLFAVTCVHAESRRLAPVYDNSTYSAGARKSVSGQAATGKVSNNSMYEILGRLEQMQLELQQLRGIVEEQSQKLKQLDEKQNNIYSNFDQRLQETTNLNSGSVGHIGSPNLGSAQNMAEQAEMDINNHVVGASDQKGLVITEQGSSASHVPVTNVKDKAENAANTYKKDIDVEKASKDTSIKKNPSPVIAQPPESQKKDYHAAYEKLRNGHNTEAITQFKQLLTSYPDGEFASKSQYWLGEAYKLTNDLKSAKRAYAKVVSHYGRSYRVPDALLKLGFIELEQHNKTSARDYLSQITVRYPDSTAAHLAKKKLLQMETIEH